MAVLSTSSVANILAHTYSEEKYLAPHERFMTKFWDTVQDFEDGGEPIGADRIWEVVTGDSHSATAGAEGADLPTFNAPSSIQCAVTALQYMASVAWTEMLLAVGKSPGLVTKMNVIDRYVEMTTRNFYQMLNRHTLTHNTARIGVVEAATTTLTTAVLRNPEHVLMFRVGLPIDFYDTDTGGSKQGASEIVSAINFETRTITFANARSLTAGWSVYRAGEYGLGMTGLRGIVDNGTLQATVFTKARATYPSLNATVLTASGGLQAYSEKLVRKALNRIFFTAGVEATEIWTNQGIISEHLNSLTGSRMFTITGDGVPSYQIGHNEEKLAFIHNGKKIPFKIESDLPDRELFAIHKPYFRRHILRKPSWIGDDVGPEGASTPMLLQAPATTTYSTNKIAGLLAFLAMGCIQPKANAVIKEISDEELASD
jgi:hypothetical protein